MSKTTFPEARPIHVPPERLSESASVIVHRNGKGTVVLMAHNLNFRGYWFGTNRVFMNAIMFGGIVERTE